MSDPEPGEYLAVPIEAFDALMDESRFNAKLVDGEWPGDALTDWYGLAEDVHDGAFAVYVTSGGSVKHIPPDQR